MPINQWINPIWGITIVLLIFAGLIGGLLGYLWAYLRQQKIINEKNQQVSELALSYTELKTHLQEQEKSFHQQLEQLQHNKAILSQEFENLANKIFQEREKSFTQSSQSTLELMLKPFREQIEVFQKRVNEVHDCRIKESSQLSTEIQQILNVGLNISQEANHLTQALKGNAQKRGAWGESQLQRTLEASGLLPNLHYEQQTAFKDQQGLRKQTDFIIKLPDNKHLIIDSKVELIDYEKACSANLLDEREFAMKQHLKAVRKHIQDLSRKDYSNLPGLESPSFVLMFMPIEAAYIETLKADPDIFNEGYRQGIILVSHTTLMPILQTVANLWMRVQSNEQVQQLSDSAGEIYNNLCLLSERLAKMGTIMQTLTKQYNETIKSVAGKQGLGGKVERFRKISTKVNKTMAPLEPICPDIESEQLSAIAIKPESL